MIYLNLDLLKTEVGNRQCETKVSNCCNPTLFL